MDAQKHFSLMALESLIGTVEVLGREWHEPALVDVVEKLRWIGEEVSMVVDRADLHSELIFAISRKFPHETRHQTALRYIRAAEAEDAAPAKQKVESV